MAYHILVAGNDVFFVDLLLEKLWQNNFSALSADNLSEIKQIINKYRIDVILLDIRKNIWGPKGALNFICELKKKSEIILISNPESVSISIEGMLEGASDEIDVPFDIETLIKKITEAISRKKIHKSKWFERAKTFQSAMVLASFAEEDSYELVKNLEKL